MDRRDLPKDLCIQSAGDHFALSATLTTQREVDAIIGAIRIMSTTLPSTRKAVAGDFGMEPIKPPTFEDFCRQGGLIP
mgnify:CR=1 FL=1